MIDWRQGGWTGSIKRWVRKEVRKHLRDNPTARRVRYSLVYRVLRQFFHDRTFGRYVILYLIVDLVLAAAEAFFVTVSPQCLPAFTASGSTSTAYDNSLLVNASGYFIAAQVGVLSVIALALALVTLIAQRENSATDIKMYYHESLAFEIVASSVALLAVLVAQLLWPLQFLLHRLDLGSGNLVFEFILLSVHLAWLLFNLSAISYFIATTFSFAQQPARELLRERYTGNIVLPRDLTRCLRTRLYALATTEVGYLGGDEESNLPSAGFGFEYGEPYTIEIETTFACPMSLQDVRIIWVRWILGRWSARCRKAEEISASGPAACISQGPLIWFTPHIDHPVQGKISWCRRRGGVPLTAFEKLVLRHAFLFRRTGNET